MELGKIIVIALICLCSVFLGGYIASENRCQMMNLMESAIKK